MNERRELWPDGPTYAGDRFGTDSLALADFARTPGVRRGCDLGCGSGILMLLLAREIPSAEMDGIEVRTDAVRSCRENLRANDLTERCRVHEADLRRSPLMKESMDMVVANPPYFPAGSGAVSADGVRAAMRTESVSVGELCMEAARLLRTGGDFCLVHRTERLADVFSALTAAGLEPKRLRFIAASPEHAPQLFLCRARKGAKSGLALEAALFQFGADGKETAEYLRICHWEGKP